MALLLLVAPAPADPADAVPGAGVRIPRNSADRMLFWSGCTDLISMTDGQLDRWHDRGVAGFICTIGPLRHLGGAHAFTADVSDLDDRHFALERALHGSRIVERLHNRHMKVYLGFYLANANNRKTPLAEWFDDAGWSDVVVPTVTDIAAAARALGFDGMALDQELYPQRGGVSTATWNWRYPGNVHTEQEVRDAARDRGRQLMDAIAAGFPRVRLFAYGSSFPQTWDDVVQLEVNGIGDANADSVNIDFWDGMTSAAGFGAVHFLNAIFYKTTHVSGASWDDALSYELNRLFAMFSKRLGNWSNVADQIDESPFVWISAGSTRFEAARDPSYVAEQLAAARKWGMDRTFANYTYENLETFDYVPYENAMRAATVPGVVEKTPPSVKVAGARLQADGVTVSGTATADLAVRVVRWTTPSGRSGAAELRWVPEGSSSWGGPWHTEWTAKIPDVGAGTRVDVSVEDIKGLSATATFTVR